MENKETKILVVGSDGMAGNIIKTYLEERGFDVYGTTRRKAEEKNNYYFDVVADFNEMRSILEKVKPNFVINCIGVLNQFAEDNKPQAVLINSFLPHFLDSLSQEYAFKFIHISTDCVFSGSRGDYTETDVADADSFYGKTKALGEVKNSKNVTFRTSIIGPDTNENGIGLFNWFIKQKTETKGFSNVTWTGVTTLQLAKSIEKSFGTDISGLYHLVNNQKINKYELLLLFKKGMNKNIDIKEDGAYVSDKSLLNTRKDFNFNIPSYEVMIDEMSKWIYNHPEKYSLVILNSKQ